MDACAAISVRLDTLGGSEESIITQVSEALNQAGMDEEAREYVKEAAEIHSYPALLRLTTQYVDVE